jgi:hypothetical protein
VDRSVLTRRCPADILLALMSPNTARTPRPAESPGQPTGPFGGNLEDGPPRGHASDILDHEHADASESSGNQDVHG